MDEQQHGEVVPDSESPTDEGEKPKPDSESPTDEGETTVVMRKWYLLYLL